MEETSGPGGQRGSEGPQVPYAGWGGDTGASRCQPPHFQGPRVATWSAQRSGQARLVLPTREACAPWARGSTAPGDTVSAPLPPRPWCCDGDQPGARARLPSAHGLGPGVWGQGLGGVWRVRSPECLPLDKTRRSRQKTEN